MRRLVRIGMLGGALALSGMAAHGETFVEQAMEHRFQLDFHVNDAALRKMLPSGWEPVIATAGPAKDANLRVIFIDRVGVMGMDGRPLGQGSSRLVYLAVPVKQSAGGQSGQMIIAGLTENPADSPGFFRNFKPAATARMTRSVSASDGPVVAEETWDFAAATGEHLQLQVKYQRGSPTKGGGDVKFFDPSDPGRYQIFRTEQGLDITRNVTTHPPDHVMEFSYQAGGGALTALFDGSEKVLSWDSFPWYSRTVLQP